MKALKILSILLLVLAPQAFAGECAFARANLDSVKGKLKARELEISQIQSSIVEYKKSSAVLELKRPELEQHLATCQNMENATIKAQKAVDKAVEALEKTAVDSVFLDQVLGEISKSIVTDETMSLAKAIREYVQGSQSFWTKAEKDFLLELAKALDVLADKDREWKVREKEILSGLANGKASAREELWSELKGLQNDLEKTNEELLKSCKAATGRFNSLDALKAKNEKAVEAQVAKLKVQQEALGPIAAEYEKARVRANTCWMFDDRPRSMHSR